MSGQCLSRDDASHLSTTYGLTYRGLAVDAQRPRILDIVGKLLRMDAAQTEAVLAHPPVHLASMADQQRVRKHQLGLANLGCITSLEHYWSYRSWLLSNALKEAYDDHADEMPDEAMALLRFKPAPGHAHLQQALDQCNKGAGYALNHADVLLKQPAADGGQLRQIGAKLQGYIQNRCPGSQGQVAVGLFPHDGEHLVDLLDCLDERLQHSNTHDAPSSQRLFGDEHWLAGRAWQVWLKLSTGQRQAVDLSAQARQANEQFWPALWEPPASPSSTAAEPILQNWDKASAQRAQQLQRLQIHCERLDQLPSLPTVVMKVHQLAQDSHASAEQLSRLVEQDPSLSARILGLVNSSWFGLRARVESIEHALVVIGREELAHLAVMISSEKVFRNLNSDAAEALWRHSSHVAEIARELGRRLHSGHSSTLFTAGLLHDVGKILLLSFEAAHMQRIQQYASAAGLPAYEMERETWGHDHARLGAIMLRNWGLPDGLCRIVDEHHGPRMGEDKISLDAALIALADHLAHRIDGSEAHGDMLRLRRCHLQQLEPQFGALTTEALDLLCEDLRGTLRGPIS